MRKLLLLLSAMFVLSTTFASSNIVLPKSGSLKATQIFLPIGKSGKTISLMELSVIPRQDLEALTGRKMNFMERMAFHSAQKKLQKNINSDGSFRKKKFEKLFTEKAEGGGFHFGGFALGFFLGLIGVLIAYLINDDLKRSRVKWAWIGCAVVLVLNIILLVSVF